MSLSSQSRRRLATLVGLAALFVLAGSANALAATLTVDGGVLRYVGAPGLTSNVEFDETGPGEVTVTRNEGGGGGVGRGGIGGGGDDDPIAASGSCTELNPPGDGTEYVCTGVTSVFADAGDGDDTLDAEFLESLSATLLGAAGFDALTGGDAGDVLSGGDGSDGASGRDGNDTVNGDNGDDFGINGGNGDDTVGGGGGDDNGVVGGPGNDTVSGGDGDDSVSGGNGVFGVLLSRGFPGGGADGNDTVNGDAGQDNVDGGSGNDAVNGGGGDDAIFNSYQQFTNAPPSFTAPTDTDVYTGGEGLDRLNTSAQTFDFGTGQFAPLDLRVTLNDVADDGAAGEGDNVRSDIEAVDSATQAGPSGAGGNDTLVGTAGTNDLDGGRGNDTLDGGLGNDLLAGGAGDDTINAQDGFADFVACGPGNDTANVDTLDVVSECEIVNRKDVGNANEDRPPTIALTSPTPNATLQTAAPTPLTVNVSDDKGVSRVLYVVNGRLVCTATVAPFSCAFAPTGADVGRTQITAIAIDTTQQTATDLRAVNVGLFAPRGVTVSLSPSRDLERPYRFRATGRVLLPASVTSAQGCTDGVVSMQVKAGTKTISTRRVAIRKNCTYSSTVSFRNRSRFGRSKRLKFTARFTGNKVLTRSTAASKFGRVRR